MKNDRTIVGKQSSNLKGYVVSFEDKEIPEVYCKKFGCVKRLTREEQLFGDYCCECSKKPEKKNMF